MFQNEIRLISLFFFFAMLDDKKVKAAASYASDLFYLMNRKYPDMNLNETIVVVTMEIWKKFKGNQHRGRPNFHHEPGWKIDNSINLSIWKEFQKVAKEDEMLAVIWNKILKIPVESISHALDLTPGTLHYRVGKGLSKIGMLSSGLPLHEKSLGH